jgi:hypothetical protein
VTRYRLLRLAQASACLLGCAVLGAGIHRLGLPAAMGVIAFCALAGGAASLGWHGVRSGFVRHEERLQAERRHRAPRPDHDERRRTNAADPAGSREAYVDPYLYRLDDDWPEPGPAQAEQPREPDIERAFAQFDVRTGTYVAPPPSARWYGMPPAAEPEDLYAHPGSQA